MKGFLLFLVAISPFILLGYFDETSPKKNISTEQCTVDSVYTGYRINTLNVNCPSIGKFQYGNTEVLNMYVNTAIDTGVKLSLQCTKYNKGLNDAEYHECLITK